MGRPEVVHGKGFGGIGRSMSVVSVLVEWWRNEIVSLPELMNLGCSKSDGMSN